MVNVLFFCCLLQKLKWYKRVNNVSSEWRRKRRRRRRGEKKRRGSTMKSHLEQFGENKNQTNRGEKKRHFKTIMWIAISPQMSHNLYGHSVVFPRVCIDVKMVLKHNQKNVKWSRYIAVCWSQNIYCAAFMFGHKGSVLLRAEHLASPMKNSLNYSTHWDMIVMWNPNGKSSFSKKSVCARARSHTQHIWSNTCALVSI